jgi:hypothetical protein
MGGARRRGVVLIATGVVLVLAIIRFSEMSDVYCEFRGFYGVVYDVVGIYPPGFSLDIAWSRLMVSFSDGCNGHLTFLFLPLLPFGLMTVGMMLLHQDVGRTNP